METDKKRGIHPLIALAAVSVTLFSLVGIAAITGLIPTSRSQTAQVATAQAETPKPTDEAAKLAEKAAPAVVHKPAAHRIAAKHARPVERAARPAEEPVKVAGNDIPMNVAQTPPPPPNQPPPSFEPPKPICNDCGVIESMREVEIKNEAIGSGTAIGGIAGAILGNQAGQGRGRDAMTVLGAIGGAVAGHEIEKNRNKTKRYEIEIRLEDGSTRLITQDNPPIWRTGDRIRLVDGVIKPRT
ncbi:MAG TPA: glycine zipper 2TM domain-containing protein [Burkholderiales bacterium]|nr:glycine zipper 2TM domain-containing protein [Burkholderiales bacterium]